MTVSYNTLVTLKSRVKEEDLVLMRPDDFGVASPALSSAFHSAGRSRLATCGSARFCSWPTRISPKE